MSGTVYILCITADNCDCLMLITSVRLWEVLCDKLGSCAKVIVGSVIACGTEAWEVGWGGQR